MIGITGATGQLGQLVVENLKAKGESALVALVRSPEKAASLGIPAKAFDYDAPETLAPALEGIDTLMFISGSEIGSRERQHKAVIEAASTAGVKWIVYTSLLNADTSPLSLAPEHLATEAAIKASGISYTFLRNGWYTENYMASVPPAVEHGAFIGAAGNGKISSAARADYAEVAATVLTSGDHAGKTYELSGDAAYTLSDLASSLSAATGKEIPYVNMSVDEYAKALEGAGLPAPIAAAYASFDGGAAEDALYNTGTTLSELIGHPTTSLETSIQAAIA